jgi:hypothetical protein
MTEVLYHHRRAGRGATAAEPGMAGGANHEDTNDPVLRIPERSILSIAAIMERPQKATRGDKGVTTEAVRLDEAREGKAPWKKWGPYLSERQWGTVREDYSDHGELVNEDCAFCSKG